MFDITDYDLIDENLELHEENEGDDENQILEDDSDYFLNEREILGIVSVQRDMWDDLSQVNPDDLPFNGDYGEF